MWRAGVSPCRSAPHRPVAPEHPALDQVGRNGTEAEAVDAASRRVVGGHPPAFLLAPCRALDQQQIPLLWMPGDDDLPGRDAYSWARQRSAAATIRATRAEAAPDEQPIARHQGRLH